jgi:ATP-dependent Clp protease ATP-binding subunit ClpC
MHTMSNIFKPWLESNLTAEARAGRLAPAFEVDDEVRAICDQIATGRHPILTGPPGVGKTAIVHEFVRRTARSTTIERLTGRRMLQLSLHKRIGALANRHQLAGEFSKLIEGVRKLRRPPVLFIRDLQVAYRCDLEDELALLASLPNTVLIGEGDDAVISEMLEYTSILQQSFVRVTIDEPNLARTERLLVAWAEACARDGRGQYTPEALAQALTLTYRFVPRARFPRKAVDLLTQSRADAGTRCAVTADAVNRRFSAAHRIPRVLADPTLRLDLPRIRRSLEAALIGQPEAVEAIVDAVGVLKSGLADIHRPLAAILLVGPTGVGKTYIAQLLAQLLFGGRERMVRINMADFGDAGDADRLFGNPDTRGSYEHVGRGILTARLASHAFGVVLLDEFEKAHLAVHDRFLQLLDEGAFVNGDGETVHCRSLMFVATSNAGYERNAAAGFGFGSELDNGHEKRANRRLEASFRFELINRFDRIVHFAPLTRDHARRITVLALRQIQERTGLRQRRLILEVETGLLDWLVHRGYDPARGARYLRHTIERYVTAALARLIVACDPPFGSRIRLMVRGDAVLARASSAPKARAGDRAAVPASRSVQPRARCIQ